MSDEYVIYDLEIVRGIAGKGPKVAAIEYCAGWHDHANMGISVLGAYDSWSNSYHVFCSDNFEGFIELCQGKLCVGFNNLNFDNQVIAATWGEWAVPNRCADLLVQVWAGVGLSPPYQYPSHAGYSLDELCKTNLKEQKSGNGALAPVLWQQGKIGSVINYCLRDVYLTQRLFTMARRLGGVIDPKTNEAIKVNI